MYDTLNEGKGKDRRGLTIDQTARILSQLCSAVKYMHANCLIHRDIKPENILLSFVTFMLFRALQSSYAILGGLSTTPVKV